MDIFQERGHVPQSEDVPTGRNACQICYMLRQPVFTFFRPIDLDLVKRRNILKSSINISFSRARYHGDYSHVRGESVLEG